MTLFWFFQIIFTAMDQKKSPKGRKRQAKEEKVREKISFIFYICALKDLDGHDFGLLNKGKRYEIYRMTSIGV